MINDDDNDNKYCSKNSSAGVTLAELFPKLLSVSVISLTVAAPTANFGCVPALITEIG